MDGRTWVGQSGVENCGGFFKFSSRAEQGTTRAGVGHELVQGVCAISSSAYSLNAYGECGLLKLLIGQLKQASLKIILKQLIEQGHEITLHTST